MEKYRKLYKGYSPILFWHSIDRRDEGEKGRGIIMLTTNLSLKRKLYQRNIKEV
uniref:Uncharacterized protein n=1 Tax=Candidatus Methanophagaceae archaeon ANME-1 ERB6 TaxID=2759912 RepID=A0A7G9YYY2_9EURY|nr:hypothetical protein HNLOENAD_00016 [Methanosarcinales archaeon ANME-1 ERB6]